MGLYAHSLEEPMPTVTMRDTTHSTQYGALSAGQSVEVDDATAAHWQSSGIAQPGGAPVEPDQPPEPEPDAPPEPTKPKRVSTGQSARGALSGRSR